MELLHVRHGVQEGALGQDVCVLVEKVRGDDAPAVILGLKVGVGEAEKEFLELPLGEVIADVPHRVGAHHRGVPELERRCRWAVGVGMAGGGGRW